MSAAEPTDKRQHSLYRHGADIGSIDGADRPTNQHLVQPFGLIEHSRTVIYPSPCASYPQTNISEEDSVTSNSARCSSPSVAALLPTELIQHIYEYLSPFDFNSARHTCQAWMMASIQVPLLLLQLKRGGWWASIAQKSFGSRDAWAMSGYLSKECILSGNQAFPHGDGEAVEKASLIISSHEQPIDSSVMRDRGPEIARTSRIGSSICVTSLDGNFFLSTVGYGIYVYRVSGESIRLVRRVECEKTVVAMAIDANRERLALAAVLEDRSGLYAELSSTPKSSYDNSAWERSGSIISIAPATAPIMDLQRTDGAGHVVWDNFTIKGDTFHADTLDFSTLWPESVTIGQALTSTSDELKSSPIAVYRDICTAKDPPFAVAIGPNSRCVAFGCRDGVELYWVCWRP